MIEVSDATRRRPGCLLLTMLTIEFGGWPSCSGSPPAKQEATEMQRTFFRAGHAQPGCS